MIADNKESPQKGRPSPTLSRQRQEAVMAAAEAVFLAKGYRTTTMDAIARLAGVSKRSLYLWHADKAALFESCIADGAKAIQLPDLDPSSPPETVLTHYARVLLPAVSTERSMRMSGLLYRESADFQEVRRALNEGTRVICRPVANYLRYRGRGADEAEQLAAMFLAALLAPTQRALLEGRPAPDQAANELYLALTVSVFSKGMGIQIPCPAPPLRRD